MNCLFALKVGVPQPPNVFPRSQVVIESVVANVPLNDDFDYWQHLIAPSCTHQQDYLKIVAFFVQGQPVHGPFDTCGTVTIAET